MAKDLDAQVEDFRTRPLDAGPYTFLAADALTMKVREGGRVVNLAVMVATAVNADGYREVLGVQVASSESGAGWLTFIRDLVARGLPGVTWQRCRTHYADVGVMPMLPPDLVRSRGFVLARSA